MSQDLQILVATWRHPSCSVCVHNPCGNLHSILHFTHTSHHLSAHVHSCFQSVSLRHRLLSTLDHPSNALALAQARRHRKTVSLVTTILTILNL